MSNWPSLSLKILKNASKGPCVQRFHIFHSDRIRSFCGEQILPTTSRSEPSSTSPARRPEEGRMHASHGIDFTKKVTYQWINTGISWTEKIIESSWKSIHHINRNWYKHRKDRSRACARCCTFHIISPFLCKIKFRKLTEHCHQSQRFAPPEISLRPPQQWYALCPSPTWAADGLWTSLSFDFCILFDSCNSCNNLQHIFCHWLN